MTQKQYLQFGLQLVINKMLPMLCSKTYLVQWFPHPGKDAKATLGIEIGEKSKCLQSE